METAATPGPLPELWAGLECTVNRVGEEYLDQLELNGHARRPEDLDHFAELGISALRYPLLWERIQPGAPEEADWSWAKERLDRLRALRLRPIVGLVHHGSGPRRTSLLDPGFPKGLADFAGEVARRHPWVEDYTPVNEPLTTARFSGLYGHWYPHGRDALTCIRMVLTECRATVLAMQGVRAVRPDARLVQTEDLGKVFSTPALQYQADFENERRWLTFDLLCGRVDRRHPLWGYLTWVGIAEKELGWFLDHPCPPDIVGINYYVTSERFLDERLERYPACSHGGNGRHRYVDTEAVRVRPEGLAGAAALLGEAWERYRLPLAITEVHLGCTREEQMRWLLEVWDAALACRRTGADVRAVTAWSLLGTFDWDSLVTRRTGHYEPGVFDLRAPRPRPTALAGMLRTLAAGRRPDHPVVASPGWWRRPDRLLVPEVTPDSSPALLAAASAGRPLLILGVRGPLGGAFARICRERGLAYRLMSWRELSCADSDAVTAALQAHQPWAVVHTPGRAYSCGGKDAQRSVALAAACRHLHLRLLTFSSDLVFDGQRTSPYLESDPVCPLEPWGRAQACAEEEVLGLLPQALVVRSSTLFGPWAEPHFVARVLRALAAGRSFTAAEDVTLSPTYVPSLVHACLDLLLDEKQGLWHLANPGAISPANLARLVARLAGYNEARIRGGAAAQLGGAWTRPLYRVLASERGTLLPALEHDLALYLRARSLAQNGGGADGRPREERARTAASFIH